MKLEAESLLWWESFELESIADRLDASVVLPGMPDTAQVVRADLVGQPALPVAVDWIVRDRATGREIGSGVRVYVRSDGRRLLWSGATARRIVTGGVYGFEFTHPDYRTQVFTLAIKPFQSQLLLDVALEPVR